MDGRTLERVVNLFLLFCALVLPVLLWAVTSYLGTAEFPWAIGSLGSMYLVFLVVVGFIYYPVIKIVEGVQVANYSRACAEIDEHEKAISQ